MEGSRGACGGCEGESAPGLLPRGQGLLAIAGVPQPVETSPQSLPPSSCSILPVCVSVCVCVCVLTPASSLCEWLHLCPNLPFQKGTVALDQVPP